MDHSNIMLPRVETSDAHDLEVCLDLGHRDPACRSEVFLAGGLKTHERVPEGLCVGEKFRLTGQGRRDFTRGLADLLEGG